MLRRRLLTTAARGAPGGRGKAAEKLQNEAETAGDPFRHFRAFKSMDEYVGVTLVQYDNQNKDGGDASHDTSNEDCGAKRNDKQHSE